MKHYTSGVHTFSTMSGINYSVCSMVFKKQKTNTNTVMNNFINNYELINNHELSVLPSYVLSNIFKCINVN